MTNSSPADGAPPRGAVAVVAGHGDFAHGLVSAVAQITGRTDAFIALSNRDRDGRQIEADLLAAVEQQGVRVIFTDLPAGSCTLAARKVLRHRADLTLVTGANLAALLDFVFQVGASGRESARHAADKGRASIQTHDGG